MRFDAGQHTANIGDVAIKMARAMADHGIKLGSVAGIRRHVAAHAHRAIAMRQPHRAGALVARCLPARHKAGFGIAVLERRRREGDIGQRALILRRQPFRPHALFAHIGRLAHRFLAALRLGCPLHDIIVLHPNDTAIIKAAGTHQFLDGRHVLRRELRRQLDHHAAGGAVHHHDMIGVDVEPMRARCVGGNVISGRVDQGRRRRLRQQQWRREEEQLAHQASSA